jgi:hypothetical protein
VLGLSAIPNFHAELMRDSAEYIWQLLYNNLLHCFLNLFIFYPGTRLNILSARHFAFRAVTAYVSESMRGWGEDVRHIRPSD